MIVWWLVKAIWNSPYTISRYFRVRRRDRGYQALSTGMIAAGAGDGALARKMNKQAAKLITLRPGAADPVCSMRRRRCSKAITRRRARKFEAMLDDPEMRLLGLRGLYLEAERLGDRTAARHYAGRAAEVAPQLAWAANATLEERDRARRLGRRAEAGRSAEGDAADRARRGQPPPRRAADRQGAGAVRHRPCCRAQTPRSRPTGCCRTSRRPRSPPPRRCSSRTMCARAPRSSRRPGRPSRIRRSATLYVHARPGDAVHRPADAGAASCSR